MSAEHTAISKVQEVLRDKGVRFYAIAFHKSGLGDQLTTANVSAKLAELFGLRFVGIVTESTRVKNRIDDLFENRETEGWFAALFGNSLPMVPAISCLIVGAHGSLLEICEKILATGTLDRVQVDTLVFSLSIQGSVKLMNNLYDVRGDCISNDFYHYHQIINRNQPSGRFFGKPSDTRHKLLIHLRLGDTIALPDLKPGHQIIPLNYAQDQIKWESVPNEVFATHYRNSRISHCIELVRSVKDEFGDSVKIDIITDGIDRPLHLLSLPATQTVLQTDFNVKDIDRYIAGVSTFYRGAMSELLALANHVLGEGLYQFKESIDLLLDADTTLSTSGTFAICVQNFLSNYYHPQKIFAFTRNVNWNLRPRLSITYLSKAPAEDVVSIMAAIRASLP